MYLAIVGAWTLSFGTTRKKFGIEPFVSGARMAEAEMNGSRSALMKTGATASTSWLPAGPTTASTSGFAWNVFATLAARAGSSCVSPSTSLIVPPPSFLIAYLEKPSCSLPMNAASPVIGPRKPILGLAHAAPGAAASACVNADPRSASDAATSSPNTGAATMTPA